MNTVVKNQKRKDADLFGEIIYSYTRAQAIEDGMLVDVSDTACEAGFLWPVAVTSAVWDDCVAWSKDDNKRKEVYQDEAGRLWDVIWMAFDAIRRSSGGTQLVYQLYRVPRNGKGIKARLTTLKLVIGPGDDGEPVVTIMLPQES
ncbi:MAG: hypothetical protein OEZ39_14155 [Gammaproteobacteria bacterium]|nr:hypothetical protein [Gammaproteobacteria bacterium]MDH5652995.1 hypothetical protein [Gammaproteobacteria bacterium]